MLYPNKTGSLFKFLLPTATWKVKTNQKEVFLTFDDGPIPQVTEWVLNVLKKYNIVATFFCVGENIYKHPTIFKRIIEEGHAVGNHTFNHLKGWKTENHLYFKNIDKWEEIVSEIGIKINNAPLFRPPYGQITFSQNRKLREKYNIVMWDIITGDFNTSLNKSICLQKSIAMTEAGTVIVFHDSIKSKENLEAILPLYIEGILEKGFVFRKL